MRKPKLYIDEDGVKRGYYVYLHKATENGEVFYVGKGSRGRAWETNTRNNAWKERVAKLGDNWEVEIFEDDLTEIEAFQIEEELVKQYGFFDEDNDQLTNHIPGGENPASIAISFGDNETDEWQDAYEQERKFKRLNEIEKEKLANNLYKELNKIYEDLWELDYKEDYSEEVYDEEGINYPGAVISAFEDAMVASKEFLKQRISWKDFCLDIECSFEWYNEEWVGNDKDIMESLSSEAFSCFIKSRKLVRKAYQKIDSGNKKDAIQLANQAATNIPIEISSKIPDQANIIQISSKVKPDKLFKHISWLVKSNGYDLKKKNSDNLNLETKFKSFKDSTSIQIKVSVKKTKKGSKGILRGILKDQELSELFAKHDKPDISFESKWCKTKYPRLSFGELALIVNQEIPEAEINYLSQE